MLKKPLFSPAQPESAKTVSSPKDAHFPVRRSHLQSILNVAHRDRTALAVRGGWVRKLRLRCFLGCGLAWEKARLGALGLGG